ncbi:PREDICTED: uncharacterized protein LOC104822747 isoform X2 [Tarenaya hassleriana]|uniref:uncharacterized protein LOC104804853 isoform X2 n=1 Tax=Tarenaya hassleriana TaxID=28532 RepID=UPI00053C88F3|nr:PREDICTED: uncharacterized protein LOC104804853 isoform X2 [Tarenaya hassleriana]XP_010552389.1 PREDICTED: uncharacterized protein LOC104822747 isoform X2 [Tarenaya hassleriana]
MASGRTSVNMRDHGGEGGSHDLLSKKAQKCIGRFFLENGIDLSAVNSPSFRQMLGVVSCRGDADQLRYKIPSFQDMNGWIFQEEWKEAEEYVKRIKDSWTITGCSLLLDTWVDMNGRELVTFIADCPEGPVYLESYDVSNIKCDMVALTLLIDEVVKKVGAENVIQIISCSVTGWVGELGEWFAGCSRGIFWSVSVSGCFELMLKEIGKLEVVTNVLDKVKNISKFIHSDPSILKLFRDHSCGKELIVLSKNDDVVMPYLALERILTTKKNLTTMFVSSDWKSMIWANKEEGLTVARLVEDSCFWNAAETVQECTIPVVDGLFLFAKAEEPQVGLIYDTMDRIKESMEKGLSHKKLSCKPFWDIIDEVWNTRIYTPLHGAGYYLNPFAFYATDFHLDPEVTAGLLASLVYMVKEEGIKIKILGQLDVYRLGKDYFFEASRIDKISGITPGTRINTQSCKVLRLKF